MKIEIRDQWSIFLIGLFVYLLFDWRLPITDPVEANYAVTAKEMLLRGDYFNMVLYGQYWYDKPIFTYWMLILSYQCWGVTEFAARFPMGLAGALSLTFGYWFARRVYGCRKTALWTALVLGTSLEFWVLSKMILTDAFLFLFDGVAMGMFYLAWRESKRRWIYIAYAAAALAVLTKGPVGIVLPLLVLGTFSLLRWRDKNLRLLFDWRGIFVFILLAVPWYAYMYAVHGGAFITELLGLHNVTRALVSEHPKDNVFYYYLLVFPVSILPWPVVFAKKAYVSFKKWREIPAGEAYLYCWIVSVLLFYTAMATKYPTYTFIAALPAAVLVAARLAAGREDGGRKLWREVLLPFVFIGCAPVKILFDSRLDWNRDSWTALFLLGAALVCLLLLPRRVKTVCAMAKGLLLVHVLIVFAAGALVMPKYAQVRSSADLAAYIPDGAVAASYGDYQNSLLFYRRLQVPKLTEETPLGRQASAWDRKYKIPKQSAEDFSRETAAARGVYIIVSKGKYADFQKLPLSRSFEPIKEGRRDILLRKF